MSRIPSAFVGRCHELQLLSGLLDCGEAVTVVFVGAAAGVGKTALLAEFATRAGARGRPTLQLSCADIAPAHAQIDAALRDAMTPAHQPPIILLDEFEAHARLERWYRTELIPRLPKGTLLVFASRHRLEKAWDDLGGGVRFQRLQLAPIDPQALLGYASMLGVDGERAETIVEQSHGVPLLVRIAAEIDTGLRATTSRLDTRGSALQALFIRMLRDVPTDDHRRALWASSLPRRLSPRLLAASLDSAGTREYFRWLARRAYVASYDDGLSIEPPFRQAVFGDLLRSAPAYHRALLWRAGRHQLALFEGQRTFESRRAVVGELLYMQRSADIGWRAATVGDSQRMQPSQLSGARERIRQSSGDPLVAEAATARLQTSPDEFDVILDAAGEVAGVVQMAPIPVGRAGDLEGHPDPVIAAALAAVDRRVVRDSGGRRRKHAGPRAIVCRVWLPATADENSASLAAAYRVLLICTLSAPDLRIIALRQDPDSPLGVLLQKTGLMTAAAGTTETPALLYRDNEVDPPIRWLQGQLAIAMSQQATDTRPGRASARLSRHDFSYAVREALNRIGDSRALTGNPLATVAHELRVASEGGVAHLIRRGLELLSESGHSRRDAVTLRTHYRIDEPGELAEGGEPRAAPPDLAAAEDRLIAALWQEYVQRMRASAST